MHGEVHRISTLWYSNHTRVHWDCFSSFVGEACFNRVVTTVDEDKPPTKGHGKKGKTNVSGNE